MKKYICQINNLKIYQTSDIHYRYTIFTPDKKALEQFRYLSDAKLSCQGIKDFLKKVIK
jgi:hypothetical protein